MTSIKVHKPLMLLKRNFGQINLERLLSEENKKKTVDKFRKYTKLRIGEKNPDKHAAILIPLCRKDDEISILYTIRSTKLRNYSGQVCFPGDLLGASLSPSLTRFFCELTNENIIFRWKNGRH